MQSIESGKRPRTGLCTCMLTFVVFLQGELVWPLGCMHMLAGSCVRCAAVLFADGRVLYTDGKPAEHIMKQFAARADNQITTLEVLAIAVGLSTFSKELQGRRVVIFSDNIPVFFNSSLRRAILLSTDLDSICFSAFLKLLRPIKKGGLNLLIFILFLQSSFS